MRTRHAVALVSCLMLPATDALAQYGAFDMGALTNTLSHGNSGGGNRLKPPTLGNVLKAPKAPAKPAPEAVLRFQPSAAIREDGIRRLIAAAERRDRDGAASMALFFESNDVFAAAGAWMKPYGMTTSNVADAIAVYLTTAWLALQGRTDDPSSATLHGVRTQVALAIGATPHFAAASDAEKQQLSDELIIQAILIGQHALVAKNQPKLLAEVQEAVDSRVRQTFGLNLRGLTLTSAGLQ